MISCRSCGGRIKWISEGKKSLVFNGGSLLSAGLFLFPLWLSFKCTAESLYISFFNTTAASFCWAVSQLSTSLCNHFSLSITHNTCHLLNCLKHAYSALHTVCINTFTKIVIHHHCHSMTRISSQNKARLSKRGEDISWFNHSWSLSIINFVIKPLLLKTVFLSW